MPIFCKKAEETPPFTYTKLVFLERLPAASVLVRV